MSSQIVLTIIGLIMAYLQHDIPLASAYDVSYQAPLFTRTITSKLVRTVHSLRDKYHTYYI